MLPHQPNERGHHLPAKSGRHLEGKSRPRETRELPLVPLAALVVRRQPATGSTFCPGGGRCAGRPPSVKTQSDGLQQYVPTENAFRPDRRMYLLGTAAHKDTPTTL